jgi:hypothetical protein
VHHVGLALAIVYFVLGGVLALWFPSDGLDLYVSYVAGRTSTEHASPYERAAYEATWRRLETPAELASTVDLPFAYPPAWVPVCIGLSLLPWSTALVLWKLLNVGFLAGSVALAFRLLDDADLDEAGRYSTWCFALVLSPTISVMTTGQTSLLVVFALLASCYALRRDRPYVAGVALAVAMVKPQLALPLVLFLLLRGAFVTLGVAAVAIVIFTGAGLALAHSDLGTYLASLGTYAAVNAPTSHIAVGIASLVAHLTSVGDRSATLIGLLAGVLLVGAVAYRQARAASSTALASVPVLLYLAPLAFRCNGYDVVAVIPLFIWSRTAWVPAALGRAIRGLCWTLVVPRGAIRFGLDVLTPGFVGADAARVAERSFRSWILLLLLPPVLAAVWTGMPRRPAGTPRAAA